MTTQTSTDVPVAAGASVAPGQKSIASSLLGNLRDYGLLLTLVALMIFFQFMTNGILFKPVNLTNIILQQSYIIVMALGMLLVMTSFQFITIGLLGEFIQRQGSRSDRPYAVKATQNLEHRTQAEIPGARGLTEIARRMREGYADEHDDHSTRHDGASRREIQQPEPATPSQPRPLPRRARR